jgi:hypothetical protein
VSRWTVKLEFVPITGARVRTVEDLRAIAEDIRTRFSDHSAAANGGSDRLVASAKVGSSSQRGAEIWARSGFYDFVTDRLPDWRLDRLVVL